MGQKAPSPPQLDKTQNAISYKVKGKLFVYVYITRAIQLNV